MPEGSWSWRPSRASISALRGRMDRCSTWSLRSSRPIGATTCTTAIHASRTGTVEPMPIRLPNPSCSVATRSFTQVRRLRRDGRPARWIHRRLDLWWLADGVPQAADRDRFHGHLVRGQRLPSLPNWRHRHDLLQEHPGQLREPGRLHHRLPGDPGRVAPGKRRTAAPSLDDRCHQGARRGLGAVVGGLEAILILSAVIVILDSYFGTGTTVRQVAGLGFLKSFTEAF